MKKNIPSTLFLLSLLIYSTHSYSQIWSQLISGTTNHLIAVSAINIDTCYVAGSNGTILKTTDGGLNWINQPTPTSQILYAMDFLNSNNGFAVGDNGALLKTINGGATWTSIFVTSESFRSVKYFNSMQIVITGGNGLIIKTTDGGTTWSTVSTSTTSNIYGMKFTSSTVGYATCFNGNILKTTDGGTTWTPSSSGVSTQLNTISFSGATNGFVVGASGVLRSTTDGGVTWSTPAMTPTSDFFHCHGFLTPSNGFITGGNISTNTGVILETTDGGLTWTTYYPGTSRLCNVDFPDVFTGYAAGLNGTILKFKINGSGGMGTNDISANPQLLKAFPNPFSNFTSIDLSSLHLNGMASFKLFDVTGKCVKQEDVSTTKILKIEKGELNAGVYYFNITSKDKQAAAGKIIIE
ncbi:MAG: T9SS type A sorting domain-containing protein [Bacteroidetes bacterium]|nr:T9SS type A sorting domain-containing protein [Bacteroidota bacterium]